MRKSFVVFLFVVACSLASALGIAEAQQPGAAPVQLKDVKQQYSYAIGLNIGRNLKNNIDAEMVIRGFRDALSGAQPAMSDADMEKAMQAFQQVMAAEEAREMQAVAGKHKEEGTRFLAENKKQQGVVTLPSGLQYRVLKQGNGPSPKATDTVTTHYAGKLLDGTEFDSSIKRGQPASFPVNRVIKGWVEALQLMKVGDKWQLFIPPDLAYGENGSGPSIPPNSTLVFEVELLGIK
jgi:FKBP-type peptidyl-prolyl cis-trans isomerase FklB